MKKHLLPIWLRRRMNKWLDHAKRISLPGLRKVPIYDVAILYVNGISNGSIGVRAGGISFSFFLSLFPSIIFLFTLIPFVPIPNFQDELMRLIQEVLPSNTYKVVESTILDIATKRRLSLLSFGFLAALFFSTNGISAMIASFNASANAFENRSWISMQFIALVLVVILFGLTTVATGLIIFGKEILNYFVINGSMQSGFSQSLFLSGQWFVILLFMLLSLSFLYYYAPAKRSNHHFFSPGSILATIVITLITLGFSYYLGHFGTYNLLYGSIGTLLALLIWLNMSSFVLLMGFELNVSIRNAQLGLKKKLELSDNSKDYERYYPKREDLLKET